jgi:hypothetical protein
LFIVEVSASLFVSKTDKKAAPLIKTNQSGKKIVVRCSFAPGERSILFAQVRNKERGFYLLFLLGKG